MIHGESGLWEKVFKGHFQQESQGPPVQPGAVGVANGNRLYAGVHVNRKGEFAQIAVDDRRHNRWILPFGQFAQKETHRCTAWTGNYAPIGQVNFHAAARLYKVE